MDESGDGVWCLVLKIIIGLSAFDFFVIHVITLLYFSYFSPKFWAS